MRVRPLLTLSVFVLGACASAPSKTGGDAKRNAALCDRFSGADEPERYATWDELAAAIGPGGPVQPCVPDGDTCPDDRPRYFVYPRPAGFGSHDIVLESKSGWVRYTSGLVSGSGAGCEWSPSEGSVSDPAYLIVSQRGDAYLSDEGACTEQGPLTLLALIDREGARVVGTFYCEGSENATLKPAYGKVTPDKDAFDLSDCNGLSLTFELDDLAACR